MRWNAWQINASMDSLVRLTIRHLWGYECIQLTNQPLSQVAKKSSCVTTGTSSIQYIRTCSPQLYTNGSHWNIVLSFWHDHVQQCRHQTEVNPNTHVLYCCSQVPTHVCQKDLRTHDINMEWVGTTTTTLLYTHR